MKSRLRIRRGVRVAAMTCVVVLSFAARSQADDEFPPFDKVSEGYTKVISTADGQASLYTVYRNSKENQLLAELSPSYASQKIFIATSIAGGGTETGFQWSNRYVYWKRIGNRMVMMEPNLDVRTSDAESKSSISRTFTDSVLLDIPIVTMGPGGGPVIDLDDLLIGHSNTFFGGYLSGAKTYLATIAKTKAFPQNIELAFQLPRADGQMTTVYYSISVLPENTGYKPRKADQRIGYFTTVYRDLGQTNEDKQWIRYINRWKLEKRDPRLKLSPPKEPIVFYIEHTTPVRYRRWIRDGILAWNKAFEQVGIINAIEVYYQDAQTGANMEKDPEDVRYNFIRWTTADLGFAQGPSRVDPRTGQILDADIVMDQSWIAFYVYYYDRYVDTLLKSSMSPASLAWLERHPDWDPRFTVATPMKKEEMLRKRALRLSRNGGAAPYVSPFAGIDPRVTGKNQFDGLVHQHSQFNGYCQVTMMQAMDLAMLRTLGPDFRNELLRKDKEQEGEGSNGEEQESLLDGLPEDFIGPLVAEVITHEVGHTLGLMHNFKASSVYTLEQINSPDWKNKPIVGSVMDYYPINLNVEEEGYQGPYGMTDIGPYDKWAIEYGYTFNEDKLDSILSRCAEPELAYGNDIDTFGPDPLCRQFDLGKDPLNYAEEQILLADKLRNKILDSVKDGESWDKARRLYDMSLRIQTRAVTMAAPWIGGDFIHRDHKGDPGGRNPVEVVPVTQQRRALHHMINNAFYDKTFGLTPELLNKLGIDKWFDMGGFAALMENDAYPIHQKVAGMQSMVLTLLMDPYRLSQVYDNELRVPESEDALTLPEVMNAVADSIWSELDKVPEKKCTDRKPYISSLRRELQHEHLTRLVDLATPGTAWGPAAGPISNLALLQLRQLQDKLNAVLDGDAAAKLDTYSTAHLADARDLVKRTLDSQYIYNADKMGSGAGIPFFFFQPTPEADGNP